MATFLFDGDELRECPYNSLHRVLSKRLLAHMSKCAAEPGAPNLEICRFNSLHRIHPDEYNAHVVECPDNRQAIRELYSQSINILGSQAESSQPIDSRDGWEPESGDYVLQGLEEGEEEISSNNSFLPQHHLYGLKRAERKRLYNQMTEDVIRRKAQGERANLTEEEANELGLTIERSEFTIDTAGVRGSRAEEADGPENDETSEETRSTETKEQTAEIIRNIKKPVDEDEDDKEEVKRLVNRAQPDCFKSRVTRG